MSEPLSPAQAMSQALALAERALFLSQPNPRVGCVITNAHGQVLGQGFTQAAGQAHAEIMALRDAQAQGHSLRGAHVYVTLEPCAHQGRTGPCCEALIAAGVARVVASCPDPNPLVAGRGLARLQAAGIEVQSGSGAAATRELNIGFFSRMERGRPWVRLKAALSLDGVTALNNGASQWISSEAARADGHAWRARACVVLTGIGTVREDNPRLDVRHHATPRQPHLVVVDSNLETPLDAALFAPQRQRWFYAAHDSQGRALALRDKGVDVRLLPSALPSALSSPLLDSAGKVDLRAMMEDLGQREVNEVHVEAGFKLNGSLLREGCVDELLLYLAPKLLGPGRGLAQLPALDSLNAGQNWALHTSNMVGSDLRLLVRRATKVAA